MGCPRHLKWSPVKGESGLSLSLLGFKRKETEKRRTSSAFRLLLLPQTFSLIGLVFANVIRRFSF